MEDFIQSLPKAELHVHLEGTLEPDLVYSIAERNNLNLPYSLEEIIAKRQSYSNLMDFIVEFGIGAEVLQTSQDFYDMAWAYFEKCRIQNIIYTEIIINTCRYTQNVSLSTVMEAYREASKKALETYAIKSKYIITIVRQLRHEANLDMIEGCALYKDMIVGIGLAGAEVGYYSSNFKHIIKRAKELGLCGPDGTNICCHAGEEGDPSYVIDALCSIKAIRIDHGVRSIESPYLTLFLAENQIPLTVCPLSNKSLKVLDRFFNGEQIVERLINAGLLITINSDDPAFFGGYLNENFLYVSKGLEHLGEETVRDIVRDLVKNGFKAAFLSEQEKYTYRYMVDQAYEEFLNNPKTIRPFNAQFII